MTNPLYARFVANGDGTNIPIVQFKATMFALFEGDKTLDEAAAEYSLTAAEKSALATALSHAQGRIADRVGISLSGFSASPEQQALAAVDARMLESQLLEQCLSAAHYSKCAEAVLTKYYG